MKFVKRLAVPVLALSLFSTAMIPALFAQDARRGGRWLSPGRIAFRARAGSARASLAHRVELAGGRIQNDLAKLDLSVVATSANCEQDTASYLAAQQDVKMAAPIYTYASLLTPNDPQFPSQAHHTVIGSKAAWDLGTGSSAITIAILDTGIDPTHPDLASKLVPGFNFFDNNTNTADVEGHGTETAGTAAAIGNNAFGVAGVAWQNPIMPVRISSPRGFADSDVIANAMVFAVDHGARVINCSFGPLQGDQVIYTASRYVQSHGGLVFVSAGNDGSRDATPAEDSISFVSATDNSDRLARFSTTGPAVVLSAPGVGIVTTARGGRTASVSGTSFSSPMAAGLAALVWSTNPALTNTQVKTILTSTARDLGTPGRDESFGFGRIDAAAAMRLALNVPPPPPDITAPVATITSPTTGTHVSTSFTVNVTATDNVGVTSVDLLVDGTLVATDSQAPFTFVLNPRSFRTGAHTLTAKARDAAGNVGTAAAVSFFVDTPAPQLTITFPRAGAIWTGRSADVDWAATGRIGFHDIVLLVDGILVGRQRTFVFRGEQMLRGEIHFQTPPGLTAGNHVLEVQGLTGDGQSFTSPPVSVTRRN